MNLAPYVDNLRRELVLAAEAGGEDSRELAERLTGPLESAARIALLRALSAAADEITRELAPGSVDVRLRGRDPEFVVTPPPAYQSLEEAAEGGFSITLSGMVASAMGVPPTQPTLAAPPEADEGVTSRITLRLPEHLEQRVDEAAASEGISVNTWLVRAVSRALATAEHAHLDGVRPARAERGRQNDDRALADHVALNDALKKQVENH